ncbi:MAG: ABC transporter substrate-binding protein [Methanosarcinaceae archaeon]|nr:ABC transporter substrate-binding protein [Methanosarcinaceae archaeon]MDD4498470.1 ABC transporter substrate-binding protein [Methanosarcinaceae archaeon]
MKKLKNLKKNPLLIIFICISLGTLFVSGCIDSSQQELTLPEETRTVLAPGEEEGNPLKVVMIFGPSDSLDPAYKWVGWYVRCAGIYETLFAYDEDMQLVPELASEYEQLNSTAWKISLRPDVRFHDGSPFNADAVVHSINRVLDPENSRYSQYEFIASVSKLDELNVLIRTKEPYAPTIASLTDPLLSIVSPNASDPAHSPVGTGPFRFESYEEGIRLTVVRNEAYRNGAVLLKGASIEYVPDPITRTLRLQAGEADIVRGIPETEVELINEAPELEVLSRETLRTAFMYVNTRKAPLDNVKVRQALNYGLNREEIVRTALEGVGGVPAEGIFPSTLPWSSNERLEGYTHDPEKAKALLAEAGISDTDGDGWLEYAGKPFTLNIRTYDKRPELKPTAEVMASQLEAIGIKTEVLIRETGALSADVSDGNYDLALYAWGVAPTGDPDYFLSLHFESSGKQAGWTGYSSSEVDEWIRLGRSSQDPEERQACYDKVQKKVLEDSPEIFVFYYTELVGENTKVKGYRIYPNEISFLTKDISLEK